jgi:endonuclease I
LTVTVVQAQIPSGYYNSAAGKTGQALASALHNIIDDHTRYPYTSSQTDTWDVLSLADEDPGNSNNILSIYKNESIPKSNHTSSGWNREHSWPKSYGFSSDNSCNYPYTDMHHLFASDQGYNSSRGNLPFGDCVSGCSTLSVDGSSYLNYLTGSGSTGTFEAWNLVRGDLARAMFYMATRYDGGTHGITGCSEPDLILTDDRNLIVSSSSNQSQAYMGLLSVLLEWHAQDPVDDVERDRNDLVYSFQGNRNPFVDHPEYVNAIWGGGGGSGSGDPWINELHYDNSGSDLNEGVEITGPAGLNLSGWKLQAYNGSTGALYKTTNLSGSLPSTQNGYGQAWFSISGLQNGAPDGIALVDPGGSVVLFLSYEGTFTASNGDAVGMTSTSIGVSEGSSTSSSQSLQLKGTGNSYGDFSWSSPTTSSRGSKNSGQTYQ